MADLYAIALDIARTQIEAMRNADHSVAAELAVEVNAPMLSGRELDDLAEHMTEIADRLLASLGEWD